MHWHGDLGKILWSVGTRQECSAIVEFVARFAAGSLPDGRTTGQAHDVQ